MPQKKQTARKTTGNHVGPSFRLSRSEGPPAAKRARRNGSPAKSAHVGDSSALRPTRSTVATSPLKPQRPVSVSNPGPGTSATPRCPPPPREPVVSDSSTARPTVSDRSDPEQFPARGPAGAGLAECPADQGVDTRRRLPIPISFAWNDFAMRDFDLSSLPPVPLPTKTADVQPLTGPGIVARRFPQLQTPISVCIQFASWLETQKYVHEHAVVQAVERDGGQLLSLARATIRFDNALRGDVPPGAVNGVEGALSEHARTLRTFAQLLQSKISEGKLSEGLERAVLRDGEPLLRLALCCLDFDRAVQGSSAAS